MQSFEEAYDNSYQEILEASRMESRTAMIRSAQRERGTEACFLTDKRLFCQETGCEWRKECYRLVAVWRR